MGSNLEKPKAKRGRGRPRSFDEADALDRITDIFWQRGYGATSLDALATGAGVHRPSLYATFGGKEAMYLRSIEAFAGRVQRTLQPARGGDAPLDAKLKSVFSALIEFYCSSDGAGARGCLVVCTAASEATERPAVRASLHAVLQATDARFSGMLEAARTQGELPEGADLEGLGALLAATTHSIALRARAGSPTQALELLAETAVTAVLAAVGRHP